MYIYTLSNIVLLYKSKMSRVYIYTLCHPVNFA